MQTAHFRQMTQSLTSFLNLGPDKQSAPMQEKLSIYYSCRSCHRHFCLPLVLPAIDRTFILKSDIPVVASITTALQVSFQCAALTGGFWHIESTTRWPALCASSLHASGTCSVPPAMSLQANMLIVNTCCLHQTHHLSRQSALSRCSSPHKPSVRCPN